MDKPWQELKEDMDHLIQNGTDCYVKFTCNKCGSRQTSDAKNTINLSYSCEECGGITQTDKIGFMTVSAFGKGHIAI